MQLQKKLLEGPSFRAPWSGKGPLIILGPNVLSQKSNDLSPMAVNSFHQDAMVYHSFLLQFNRKLSSICIKPFIWRETDKTHQVTSKLFIRKRLSQTVQPVVKMCELCQKSNPFNWTIAPPGIQRHGRYLRRDWQLDFTYMPRNTYWSK